MFYARHVHLFRRVLFCYGNKQELRASSNFVNNVTVDNVANLTSQVGIPKRVQITSDKTIKINLQFTLFSKGKNNV